MSCHCWTIDGYGICTEGIVTTKERLLDFVRNAPNFEKKFTQWLDDAYSEEELKEMEVHEIIDEYEDDRGENGLAPIMRDVINEAEDIMLTSCSGFDGDHYLLIEPSYPWSELSEKEKSLAKEAAGAIFRKYVKMLTDKDVEASYWSVENGG